MRCLNDVDLDLPLWEADRETILVPRIAKLPTRRRRGDWENDRFESVYIG